MKKIKHLIVLSIAIIMCVSGCSNKDKEGSLTLIETDNYRIALPFEYSTARETHIQFNRSGYDIDAVGEGLLEYSKDYFPVDKYYLQEGQLLNRNTLQAGLIWGDKEGILGSKSEENPYGLNPEDGMKIPAETGVTITAKAGSGGTIPVIDVFEVNFITSLEEDAEIKGVSLAIVLNPNVRDKDGKEHVISDENLLKYGEEAGRNLVAYLKQQPEISSKIEVMVALFKADSSDTSLPGNFIAVGHGKGNVDRFKEVDEKWAIIPGNTASSLDSTLVAEFNSIKDSLHDFLPNNTDIIGKGFFVDNRIEELQIDVTVQCKTYTEKLAATQYVAQLLSNFSNSDMSITVRFDDGECFAMISKASGAKKSEIIIY